MADKRFCLESEFTENWYIGCHNSLIIAELGSLKLAGKRPCNNNALSECID